MQECALDYGCCLLNSIISVVCKSISISNSVKFKWNQKSILILKVKDLKLEWHCRDH